MISLNIDIHEVLSTGNESIIYNVLNWMSNAGKKRVVFLANTEHWGHKYSPRVLELVAFTCMNSIESETVQRSFYKELSYAENPSKSEEETEKDAHDIMRTDMYTGSQWDCLEDYLDTMKSVMTEEAYSQEVKYWHDNTGTGLPRRGYSKAQV